ncbi:MAG: hypothetical protein GTO63_18330, partial [Anaerolineae bacterium]|nr:hypothetical protein [Anaerolineae bacterium]NIN96728.1 hypothetical protein [Anaerolineae bacterium]
MTLAGRDRLRVLEQLRQVEAIKKPLPSTLELLGSDAVRLMHFGGVGSAKTWNGSLYLFSELMPDRKPGEGGHLRHYWITGPNYDLCGRAFDLILNWSYQL